MSLRFFKLQFSLCSLFYIFYFSFFCLHPHTVSAEVYLSQEEAIKAAFPNASRVEQKTFVLTHEQQAAIELSSQARLSSKLLAVYTGYQGDNLLGFAAIETNVVRTHSQTFMVVLNSEGQLQQTIILAFHEPPEYLASPRWLKQFEGIAKPEEARVGTNIAGIVGSSLTSEAISGGIRKFLAAFEVLNLKESIKTGSNH